MRGETQLNKRLIAVPQAEIIGRGTSRLPPVDRRKMLACKSRSTSFCSRGWRNYIDWHAWLKGRRRRRCTAYPRCLGAGGRGVAAAERETFRLRVIYLSILPEVLLRVGFLDGCRRISVVRCRNNWHLHKQKWVAGGRRAELLDPLLRAPYRAKHGRKDMHILSCHNTGT
jgi:hypothetical protein